MGAEGSIRIMPLWQWKQRTDRDPASVGFYVGRMLGQEAIWSYYGENTDYEMSVEMYPRPRDLRPER